LRDARMFLPGYLGRTRREALERQPWWRDHQARLPTPMDRSFLSGVWCHVSPAPDKVRGCNPARASLRPQAGRGRCWAMVLKKSGRRVRVAKNVWTRGLISVSIDRRPPKMMAMRWSWSGRIN